MLVPDIVPPSPAKTKTPRTGRLCEKLGVFAENG